MVNLERSPMNRRSPVQYPVAQRHIQETRMCRLQSIVDIPHKNGKALVGIAVGALVNHDGERPTLAVGDNRAGRLFGQSSLHDHHRLRFTLHF